MTSDTTTPPKPKQKRSRKLPRRAILDADFVVPSSQRVIDDLMLERAPSQHDRVILSELWGGNDPHSQKSIMPAVSIGKPKRSLHGDTPTKPKTYKDLLKEKHKDDWAMDLSNLTFVPATVKGKHIRSSSESTPPVTEASDESASELGTDSLAPLDESDVPVNQAKHQTSDTADANRIDYLDAGSPNQVGEGDKRGCAGTVNSDKIQYALDKDESETPTGNTEDIQSIHITSDTGKDNESDHEDEEHSQQDVEHNHQDEEDNQQDEENNQQDEEHNHQDKEHDHQDKKDGRQAEEHNQPDEASPIPASCYNAVDPEDLGDMDKALVNATADEPILQEVDELQDKHTDQEDDHMPGYSDDECVVDHDIVEKLLQMPVIADPNEGGSNDLSKSEMAPTTKDGTASKEEIRQEPPPAETNPSISSSTDYILEQQLAPEACLSGNIVRDENFHQHQCELKQMEILSSLDLTTGNSQTSTLSAKDQEEAHLNIPLDDTTAPSNDDKPESDEDQELMDTEKDGEELPLEIAAPVSRQMLVSETQNSAMLSDKVSQKQAEKPLLNLDQPVYEETDLRVEPNPKIIEKWQPNQKHHPILNVLKSTTALNWIEDGHDDMRKKDIGFTRKRQLEARFSKPFVTKKRIKSCWFVDKK